ncbi:MAG: metallophosphoesterase [bacterium]|nr:metallophosphoesterase [bacterium]MCY3889261.1 metallophosphoesterase [bacterium]
MSRWYTSDHHFGHENIIRYCGRPFPDADTMDKEMVARWNDLVADSDEVWILGDLVMGGKTQGLAGHVARLKGQKILVPGNHDRCWQGNKDHRWERADYYHIGGIHRASGSPLRDREIHRIDGRTALAGPPRRGRHGRHAQRRGRGTECAHGRAAPLAYSLWDWKATAEVQADPDLHRRLAEPIASVSGGPVPIPAA